ncbi:hypothetical protein ACOMHN_040447 [Nucella lapillus]
MMQREISEGPGDELSGPSSTSAAAQRSVEPAALSDDPPGHAPDEAVSTQHGQHVLPNGRVSVPPVIYVASSTHASRRPPRSRISELTNSWHGEDVNGAGAADTRTDINTRDVVCNGTTEPASFQNGRASNLGLSAQDRKVDAGGDGTACQKPPPVPVVGATENGDKTTDGTEEDARTRRLRHRLMASVFSGLVLYITALLSVSPVLSQYLFRRTAQDYRNLTNVSLQQTPCAGGQNGSVQQDLNWVQAHTSQQLLYLDFSEFIPAIFVALIFGSYADYFGRKFLVLAPIVGGFLKSLVILAVVYLDLDVRYLYLGFALEGLAGSFYVLSLGLFAAIADVTISSRQRVMLFASLEISIGLAGALSLICMGFLINALGFAVPGLLICCCFLLACVCVLLLMPETLQDRPRHLVLNPLTHLRKVFGFYYSEGSRWQRALFVLGQVTLFFIVMVNLGRMNVETLFEINSPLCWGSVQIGVFMGIRILLQNFTSLVVLKVLSRWMRIELIGMLGLVSGIAGFTLQALADTDLMMYISGATGVLIMTVSPVVRTLLSRMAPRDKQGALFASMSAVETICHLTASTIYNNVYTATLNVFPGAVFLLIAAILTLDCAMLMLFMVLCRKFPHFQEVQIEVKIPDPDASATQNSLDPSPPADETTPRRFSNTPSGVRHGQKRRAEETTPLLFNTSTRRMHHRLKRTSV